jgi:hypothetical protein
LGLKVLVHSENNSKLDMRGSIGHWVGVDEESAAHRIYWPNRRTVGVERSVSFNLEDDEVVTKSPLEGEWEVMERPPAQNEPVPAPVEAPQAAEQVPPPRIEKVPDVDDPQPLAKRHSVWETYCVKSIWTTCMFFNSKSGTTRILPELNVFTHNFVAGRFNLAQLWWTQLLLSRDKSLPVLTCFWPQHNSADVPLCVGQLANLYNCYTH